MLVRLPSPSKVAIVRASAACSQRKRQGRTWSLQNHVEPLQASIPGVAEPTRDFENAWTRSSSAHVSHIQEAGAVRTVVVADATWQKRFWGISLRCWGHLNSCDPFFRRCGQCLVLMHGRTGEDRAVEEHPGSAPVRDFLRWFT